MEEQRTLKQEAEEHESPSKTKNISELNQISVDVVVVEDNFVNKEGEEVKQKVIVVEGEKYRVPVSVLNNLKVLLEDNKDLKFFKVKKTGEGMDTRYIAIPL